jgi:hypothetical protein
MRLGLVRVARVLLLGGPVALALFSGGYFDEARAWAGLGAWLLVTVALLIGPGWFAPGRGGWLALGGLSLLAVWTLLSITWAPVAGNAYHAGQLAALYVGGLLAATLLLRSSGGLAAVEPALVAGALLVIGYGISARLLPGVVHLSRSVSAQGRLEQPLTYWNAMGELAALGLVLAARIGGRNVATASCALLGLGLYMSLSRGALFAWAAGLVALVVAAPSVEQLRTIAVAVAAGALATLAASPLHGFTSLTGSEATRQTQGVIMLGVLVAVMVAAGAAQWRISRAVRAATFRLPRRAPLIALLTICAGLALAIVLGAKESSTRPLSAGATRYATLQSNRYAYWRVALRALEDEPLRGIGAGGWSIYWLRYRPIEEFAQDAHSLPLQTLAELGLVGLGLLAMFVGGMALAAEKAHRVAPEIAAGPIAGLVVYAVHAPLDWDWQMPAVTLVAIVLAGALLAVPQATESGATAAPQ